MNIKKIQSSLLFRSGIASVDQLLLSLVNFTVSIVLIKYASKLEYGYYALVYPIILFSASVQNAIINAPLAVLLSAKNRTVKSQYVKALFYGQLFVIFPAAVLFFSVMVLLNYWGYTSNLTLVSATAIFAAIGILFREFFRGYFYAEEESLRVLKMDTSYVIIILLLMGGFQLFYQINTSIIFALMGFGALLVALAFRMKDDANYNFLSIRKSYKENWRFGKWALVGVLVTHIQNYSYIYILGALIGRTAVAEVSAARLLLAPLIMIEIGWAKVIVPHGAKLREQDQLKRFLRELMIASLLFAIGIVLYICFLSIFSTPIKSYLLTEKYSYSMSYVSLWGTIFVIRLISLNASLGLQVTKNFRIITIVNMFTMLVTLALSYVFILRFGIKGALTALIAGGILLALALCIALWRQSLKFESVQRAK
jgi:O-antigen/teichoic acid export membrane protein